MSRSSLIKEHIFDESSQWRDDIDPKDIKLIYDRVLVKDLPDDDTHGSIILPPSTLNKGAGLRLGVVMAVGGGDRWIEKGFRPGDSEPRRAAVTMCQCGHHEKIHSQVLENGRKPCLFVRGEADEYQECPCKDFNPRLMMEVKPGDIVAYDRRKECELYINHERYSLIHQEQSIYAVIE